MTIKARISKNDLKALEEHGIRYSIHQGELFINSRDWGRYSQLCEEGKLPKSVC